MKCIIDIPVEWCGDHGVLRVPYKVQDAVHWFNTGIDMDFYDGDEAEQRGIDKAWEFARHLYNLSPDVVGSIYRSMNGSKGLGVALEMPYAEAQAEYDAWQKRKDEIHVGDEVDYSGIMGIVCWIRENEVCGICPEVWDKTGFVTFRWNKNKTLKTGRSFPGLAEMFEKMKESE